VITVQDLPLYLRVQPQAQPLRSQAFKLPSDGIVLAELEKQLIVQALEKANNNKVKAGKLLGLSRTQLRTRMKNHGLEAG
jgi:DNA-binding NtrC family response regulator